MNKIKSSAIVCRATVATLLFSQFLLLQAARAELLYPVEVNSNPTQVRISKINIKKLNEMIVLTGKINRRAYNSHVLPGHIDILVMNANNQLLKQEMINISSLNLRRYRYDRQFKITFANEFPEGSYFKVNWHQSQSGHLSPLNSSS